jgi:sugar phosphate isomerase/epimerase
MTHADEVGIALELYTVRDETARDFAGTLERVADIGYRAVEFAGYGGYSAPDLAALLDRTGLQAAATHVQLGPLREDLAAQIEYCHTIGCSYLVLASASQQERERGGEALGQEFNEIGTRCREDGITFGYHNHDFEFALESGRPFLERLLDATDPESVALELDVYWAAYAGVDPAEFLDRYRRRIPLLHFKDMAPDRSYTEVGEGTLDLAGLYAMAPSAGVRWCIVEHDAPTIPSLESARRSLINLRGFAAPANSER